MAAEPTYPYYRDQYKGSMAEAAFKASLRHAVSSVKEHIWPNEPDGSDEYKNAVCAAAEVEAAYGNNGGVQGGMASFTVGAFSATSSGRGSYAEDMGEAIERELSGSPLLYRGLGDLC